MGGCKCSYRNCTVKSDGRTHLFHFPVFDKVRCNKWLKNAQRDDYLNLKVTQLKNRVICQNHFKDDQFMNFKKDKLKFDAVPTENGPFCNQDKSTNDSPSINAEISTYPITLEDIESDTYTVDKRPVPTEMKYWDFLTNGELSDLDCLKSTSIVKEEDNNNFKKEIQPVETISNQYVPLKTKDTPTLVVPPYLESYQSNNQGANQIVVDNVPITFEPLEPIQLQNTELNQTPVKPSFTPKPKEPKIKIISEKKISEPLKLIGIFEPVSPNLVLPVRKPEEDNKKEVTPGIEYLNTEQNKNSATIFNDSFNYIVGNEDIVPQETIRGMSMLKNSLSSNKNDATIKRNKLILKRAADIEKKRKFNMKLRDVLNEGLNTFEKRDQISVQNTPTDPQPKSEKARIVKATELNIDQEENYSSQKNTFMLLQEQMKQMQEALMDRIDNNSKAISDLQKTFVPHKRTFTVSTQTQVNDEVRKKELFREMSQYLSPDTKSAVYEELFINKYARKSYLIYSPIKRKKHR